MPILHTHPLSNFSQRVHIALLEKGVSWETSVVDMASGAHRKPPYLAINPYGKVPSLVVGDLPIYESTAILEYLEELHPQPALLPASLEDRARARSLIKAADVAFTSHVTTIIFPKRFLPQTKWRLEEMEAAKALIEKHLRILEGLLAGRQWAVGDRFGMVEVCYAPFLVFLPMIEVAVPTGVERWTKGIFERDSVRATRIADAPKWV